MPRKQFLAYALAGVVLSAFLTTLYITPATSQAAIPPSESQGVRIATQSDKASYVKGEKVPIGLSLSNTGTKPFQTANLLIGFDVLKDGQPVYGYRMIRDYAEQAPFTLHPGDSRTYAFSWPLKVNVNATTTSDAEPGTYVIRTSMFSPIELSTDTIVEVKEQ